MAMNLFPPLNRSHGQPFERSHSAHPRTPILSKKSYVERLLRIWGRSHDKGTGRKMMEWLEEHLVTDSMDIQFLTFQVLRLQKISSQMQQEQQQLLTLEGVSGTA